LPENIASALVARYGYVEINSSNITTYFSNHTTTNGSVVSVPLLHGNYTLKLVSSLYGNVIQNITLAAAHEFRNITTFSEGNQSFNFEFRDEETNALIATNGTVQLIPLSGQDIWANYSVTTGILNAELDGTGEWRVDYNFEDYNSRSYYFARNNLSGSTTNLTLYSLLTADASFIVVNVKDESGDELNNVTVKLFTHFANESAYRIVEMSRTDQAGDSAFSVVPNQKWYYFQFEYDSVVRLITTPQKFTTTSYFFQLILTDDFIEDFRNFRDVFVNVSWNNETGYARFVYADSNSVVDQACLIVSRERIGGGVEECVSCSTASSGTLLCFINQTSAVNGTYMAKGYLYIDGVREPADFALFLIGRNWADHKLPLFLAMIFTLVFTMVAARHPGAAVMLNIVAILLVSQAEWTAARNVFILGSVIIGGIILWKLKEGGTTG